MEEAGEHDCSPLPTLDTFEPTKQITLDSSQLIRLEGNLDIACPPIQPAADNCGSGAPAKLCRNADSNIANLGSHALTKI
jgi:hypothetical protein